MVVVAGAAFWVSQGVGDDLAEREALKRLGVLTTMAADGRQIGAVNFSTIKDKGDFREAFDTVLSLRGITSLNLDGMPVQSSDFQSLQRLSTLASLSLKDCGLDDQGMASVGEISTLETLHVTDANVTDAGLSELVGLGKLATIDLSGTRICCDLSPLAELPSLKWVLLVKCQLDSGALSTLKTAPALSRLTLTRSGYDDGDLEVLKAAIGGLKVDEFD